MSLLSMATSLAGCCANEGVNSRNEPIAIEATTPVTMVGYSFLIMTFSTG